MGKNLWIFTFFCLSNSLFAEIPPNAAIGNLSYGGTGCPQGTAAARIDNLANPLHVFFSTFTVGAGKSFGQTVARKNCDLAIPINIPSGFQVSITDLEYAGHNRLPLGGSSEVSVEYFFAGGRGPKIIKQFRGHLDDMFNFQNSVQQQNLSWSPCGQDAILRISINIQTQTNNANEDSITTINQASSQNGLHYHLQWRKCR